MNKYEKLKKEKQLNFFVRERKDGQWANEKVMIIMSTSRHAQTLV